MTVLPTGEPEPQGGRGPIVFFAVSLAVAIAGGAFFFVGRGGGGGDDPAAITVPSASPTTSPTAAASSAAPEPEVSFPATDVATVQNAAVLKTDVPAAWSFQAGQGSPVYEGGRGGFGPSRIETGTTYKTDGYTAITVDDALYADTAAATRAVTAWSDENIGRQLQFVDSKAADWTPAVTVTTGAADIVGRSRSATGPKGTETVQTLVLQKGRALVAVYTVPTTTPAGDPAPIVAVMRKVAARLP